MENDVEIELGQKQMVSFDRAKDGDKFDIAKQIRQKVFVEEQNVPAEIEIDSFDDEARHYLMLVGDKAVGTARMFLVDPNTVRIGRLAILENYRKKGLGFELMQHIISEVKAKTVAKKIVINAQIHLISFYSKLGFSEVGKEYEEAGIMHVSMEKEISLI